MEQDLHLRRVVWRCVDEELEWKTYGFARLHFWDHYAICGLEVAMSKVENLGESIDPEAVKMIKKTYVDDGSGAGSKDAVNRLLGEEVVDSESNIIYTGTIAQLFYLGGFIVRVMVRDGEWRPEVVQKLGRGVLGLSCVPSDE